MPQHYVRAIEPIVQHGIRELREGATVRHTLTEVALMGALVGAGATPTQAIRQVEQMERQLIGMGPWERAERPMFHQQPMMAPTWGGKGMQQQWGISPWGMQTGMAPWGMQQPTGMMSHWGKQPTGMMSHWGKQPMTMTGDWGH